MTGSGKGGRITRIPPDSGARYDVLGDLYALKIRSEDTGGAFALWELSSPPGNGPPPHVHRREGETFYVLEGTFEFVGAGEKYRVGTGSLVHVPKDTLHTFRNVGASDARAIVLVTPGGFERFFEEVGSRVDGMGSASVSVPPDIDRLVAVARRYHCDIPPPSP